MIGEAYEKIAEYYEKTDQLEAEAKHLNDQETLFDMQKSTYKQLKECRVELQNLKQMWDLISLVDYQFGSWKQELWDKIDVDGLQLKLTDMTKKLTNPMLPQNKDMKSWKAFVSLGERCKQMNTILPLINDLH